MSDATWWQHAVVYQIYPRSFADADGDGMGDLRGITEHVGHLVELGVDAVWLSPFYPSALADGGYDVDDYRDVDPRLGTLADFDDLVEALHDRDIKVIVDIVPNHTSDRHPWFREALRDGPGSAARARCIFRDGAGPGGCEPPNDWQSGFGGSAWQQVSDGQWYFHHFARQQPDLNWDDEGVRDDFRTTLRFWSDRGVDGFRVDVAHGLAKDLSQLSTPWKDVGLDGIRDDGSHPLWDRDDVHEIYADWRRLFDEYDPPRFAVAEASVTPTRRARYAAPTGLGQVFNFEMQDAAWTVQDYRRVIDSGLSDMTAGGSSTTWLLGCHDSPRVATRYGLPLRDGATPVQVAHEWLLTDGTHPSVDLPRGRRRTLAALLVLLALPGCTYIYQGDELALPEVGDLAPRHLQDPIAARSRGVMKGRDGCRVPLPWRSDGPSFGFGADGPTSPPQPADFAEYAVAVQAERPDSPLNVVRNAIATRRQLRRRIDADGTEHEFTWLDSPADALIFRRGGWTCVANFGSAPVELPSGRLVLSSVPVPPEQPHALPGDATAWLTHDPVT